MVELTSLENIIQEAYESVVISLEHQKDLHEELYTPNPTQLRSDSLGKIKRKIALYSDRKSAYEIVADDLCINLNVSGSPEAI